MSFSLNFAAASAERARELVSEAHLPDCVKEFILVAIEGARFNARDSAVYFVKADGHLCDDGQSYAVSTAHIDVHTIPLR
jgi:hypothetical protein